LCVSGFSSGPRQEFARQLVEEIQKQQQKPNGEQQKGVAARRMMRTWAQWKRGVKMGKAFPTFQASHQIFANFDEFLKKFKVSSKG